MVLVQDFHLGEPDLTQQVQLKQQRARRVFLLDVGEAAKAACFPPKGERGICPSTRSVNYSRPQKCRPAGGCTGLAALPTWHFQSSPQTGSTLPIHKSLSMPPLRCEATDFGRAGTARAFRGSR
jgi:hypothetical protein